MLKSWMFPVVILLIGLLLTMVNSYDDYQNINRLKNKSFENQCHQAESKILIQLHSNAQVLYNSSAFILSSDTIKRYEWKKFQELNKSLTELPGIRGIGYAVVVSSKELYSFENQIREDGFPDFKVFPEGKRDIYSAVLYIEPHSSNNLAALGFDGLSEPARYEAMTKAKDQDQAIITDKVYLIQSNENPKSPGTILYAPVFKSSLANQTAPSNDRILKGWVFSLFQMDDLMKGILKDFDFKEINLRVYDENNLVPERLLFDSDSTFNIQHKNVSKLTHLVDMNFNGKIWTLQFTSYQKDNFEIPSNVVGVFFWGSIISILLFILAINVIKARNKNHEIQMLNEELKKANSHKDRFISILAHDLRSPFNTLLGFSELLTENLGELDKKDIETFANQIFNTAQNAHNLLDELLLWAKAQSNQFPYNPKKLNLNELCKNVITSHSLIAEKKKINLLQVQSESVYVMADELMIKTILRNLLVNAIKFTHENGTVSIGYSVRKEMAVISVSDTGIGISGAEKAKLFNINSVYSKTGTANEKGTGLGLLLCKELVLKHGGEIWVESKTGKGSQFFFTLPLARNPIQG